MKNSKLPTLGENVKKRAPLGRGIDGLKGRAKAAAAELGHSIDRSYEERPGHYLGRCTLCQLAAVTIIPNEPKPSPHTGDYFGGSATRVRCTANPEAPRLVEREQVAA